MGCPTIPYQKKSEPWKIHNRSENQVSPIFCSNYYPFGLQINSLSWQREDAVKNRYTYNGKEMQDDLNLNWYDYGFRMQDPALGRWHVIDGLSDLYSSWSPYNYTMNNPIKFIDPNGAYVDDFSGNNTGNWTGVNGKPERNKNIVDMESRLNNYRNGRSGSGTKNGAEEAFDNRIEENTTTYGVGFDPLGGEEVYREISGNNVTIYYGGNYFLYEAENGGGPSLGHILQHIREQIQDRIYQMG